MNNLNQTTKDAWEANAEVWDRRMGDEGNDFFNILCWPALASLYSIKTSRYMTPYSMRGLALRNQPKPQVYFERPLQTYLNLAFQNGFILDGFEERAFPPETPQVTPLGWGGKYSEIPAALVARLRLSA